MPYGQEMHTLLCHRVANSMPRGTALGGGCANGAGSRREGWDGAVGKAWLGDELQTWKAL
jgi:hypothetical protein